MLFRSARAVPACAHASSKPSRGRALSYVFFLNNFNSVVEYTSLSVPFFTFYCDFLTVDRDLQRQIEVQQVLLLHVTLNNPPLRYVADDLTAHTRFTRGTVSHHTFRGRNNGNTQPPITFGNSSFFL